MTKNYLKEMTEIALKYDTIIAEDLKSYPWTYDSSVGKPKLYWDSDKHEYVFVGEERLRDHD